MTTDRVMVWMAAIVFGSTAVVASLEGAAGWSAVLGALAGAMVVTATRGD